MINLHQLSRRELQLLARELNLCKANAKSDTIISKVEDFIQKNSNGIEQIQSLVDINMDENKKEQEMKQNTKKLHPTTEKNNENVASNVLQSSNKEEKSKQTTDPTTPATQTKLDKAKSQRKTTNNKGNTAQSTEQKQIVSKTVTNKSQGNKKNQRTKELDDVDTLVSSREDLIYMENGKIKCTLTGHELSRNVSEIKAYINGKKYQRAKQIQISFSKYAPMFEEHRDDQKKGIMLWCAVTETEVPRDIKQVQIHMNASKYQNALPEWKEKVKEKKKQKELEEAIQAMRQQKREDRERKKAVSNNPISTKRPLDGFDRNTTKTKKTKIKKT